jgi:hypothetical protein
VPLLAPAGIVEEGSEIVSVASAEVLRKQP